MHAHIVVDQNPRIVFTTLVAQKSPSAWISNSSHSCCCNCKLSSRRRPAQHVLRGEWAKLNKCWAVLHMRWSVDDVKMCNYSRLIFVNQSDVIIFQEQHFFHKLTIEIVHFRYLKCLTMKWNNYYIASAFHRHIIISLSTKSNIAEY